MGSITEKGEKGLDTQREKQVIKTDMLDKLISNPAAGASLAGVVVLGSAVLFGAIKTAIAVGVAYGAYRYFEAHQVEQPRSTQAS